MKKFTIALALSLLSATAFAGEDVIVSWTPPSDLQVLPYSGYKLYWTDSTGAPSVLTIPDVTKQQVVIPDVPFGDSEWYMTSLCADCSTTESLPSSTVAFNVKSKGVPSAPTPSVSLAN